MFRVVSHENGRYLRFVLIVFVCAAQHWDRTRLIALLWRLVKELGYNI